MATKKKKKKKKGGAGAGGGNQRSEHDMGGARRSNACVLELRSAVLTRPWLAAAAVAASLLSFLFLLLSALSLFLGYLYDSQQ